MKKIMMISVAALSAAVCSAEMHWMCPQMEMELYRVHQMRDDVRRMGLYAGHPGRLPATRDNVFFRRKCTKDAPLPETWGAVRSTRYDEAEGRRYVEVRAGFSGCAAIRSAETGWEAQVFDGSWHPVATYPDALLPPHRERLPEDRAFAGLVATNGYYDAGEELFAHVECAAEREPRLFVGESVPEMMDENRHHLEYDPTMVQVADGRWRTPHPLAFRYLRFASDAHEVKVVPVGRNRPVVGRILTDNARWSQMFDVGVRTLAHCSDEFLIDGVKRDRLPWAGDLTVSLMADAYVYGDAEVARRSLSVMDAYQDDVNGIVTYSMWTIISHDLYQLYFGDRKFLEDRWWRIKWRVDNLVSRCDENGFVAKDLKWVFVDWAKPESKTAMHMIWYGALQAAVRLADRVGDPSAAAYRTLAEKVRTSLNRSAWDETRGLYCADPGDLTVFGRQANIFAIVFDVADDAAKKRIGEELAANRLPPVGTPYVYGWELVALNRTGHHQAFLDGLERVFGAMLDAGATTFWEGYDANEKGNDRYRFYGRPWGKSLCHVWSAWPAFVFVSEGLGARPTSDGWKTWEQKPIPGAEGLRALVPTPWGVLRIGAPDDGDHPLDKAREKLAAAIEGEVASATHSLEALRAKALGNAPDIAKVRVGTWSEIWPAGSGLVTNVVTGEVWNDAIQATLDAKGAVYVPARAKPYYLDAPITLASGQAFVADPTAEFRLVPHVDLCLLRNRTVVGMDQQTLEIPFVPYDRGIYIEGGIWTSLLTTEKERNGNFWGRVSKENPINGGYGAFVLNHVDGVVIRDVTFRQCNMHAIQLSDVHRFRVDGVTFDRQGRDGVHVHGACDWGVIRRVSGDSRDDFVALNSWDWCHTSPTIGPIHHVLVEDSECVYAPNGDRPEGCCAIRIQPGNRKRPDGKGVCACPIDSLVFRRLRNVREFKMYDQPNLELGRDVDRSEPIGTMRDIYFDSLMYDRPGVFEIADHLIGCDVSRVRYTYDARGEKLLLVHPKSGTWKHTPTKPETWVEIYSPDEDYAVRDFSARDFTVRAEGRDISVDAKSFVKVANGELNPDYPATTPRGGTGKVTFAYRD